MDWKKYKPVGVQSVDMCASVIFAHRQKAIPIKAVHLLPRMHEQFQWWTQNQLGRELNPDEKMTMDGVYIEKGYARQTTPVVVELWEEGVNVHSLIRDIKAKA